jgi:hypothetical protein
MAYAEVLEVFPPELRLPIARLVDALKAEFEVPRADFADLKVAVRDLAEAQARTEVRMGELAQAQARTEARLDRVSVAMEELAQAQTRTEARLEELTQAQARTEARLDRVSVAVEELAQAQARTEHELTALAQTQARTQDEVTLFRRTFLSQIGGLGARWGLQTEEAFRHGIRTILEEVGFTIERFLTWDAAGEVFGHPEQVELDIVIQNGKAIVVEIKSSLDRANTYLFNRKVEFYTRHTGRQVDRKVVIASYADERAKEVAMRLGIEICTDVTEFR